MARLAWFAPLPSTLARCACHDLELVTRLEASHTIEWFCGQERPDSPRFSSAHDFVWKHLQQPYDLMVYELADTTPYAFVWPYLVRHPGLVILHDGRLHDSRGGSLLRQVRVDDYRAEFGYNHPEASSDVPRLAHAELLGLTRELWPMRRVVLESSRLLLAPHPWIAEELRQEASHDRIEILEPAVRAPRYSDDLDDARTAVRVRQRYGFATSDVVFASVTAPSLRNRVPQVLSAFAQLDDPEQKAQLLLFGDDPGAIGATERVTLTGPLDDQSFADHLAASDVWLSLQWPDRSDGVRSWLTAMAAGKPTVVADHAHRVDVPSLDPRDWQPRRVASPAAESRDSSRDPACVTIDIVDEGHSLKLAMRRLAKDSQLRSRLGANARELWATRFSADRMVNVVEGSVTRALEVPPHAVQRPDFPPHLLADGTDVTRTTLETLGLPPELSGLLL
jgi:glycosyltransferase involved in cell wall biosynthesis